MKIAVFFKHRACLPFFFPPQVTISELVPLGHPVLTIVATDVESSENITYRILPSSKMFSVDPTNGELFVVAVAFIGLGYREETWNNPFQIFLK